MKLTMREYFMQNLESNGVLKKLVREEIVVDNAADLPTADYKEGQILAIGSAVWNVSTGDFYGLDSNGVWINQKTGAKTIQITQQPADAEVTSGESVTFTVAANGYSLSYKWQSSSDGTTWSDVSGATSATYTFTTASADYGNYYHCVVTDGDSNTATSNAASLTVNEPEPEPEPEPDPEPDDDTEPDADPDDNTEPESEPEENPEQNNEG